MLLEPTISLVRVRVGAPSDDKDNRLPSPGLMGDQIDCSTWKKYVQWQAGVCVNGGVVVVVSCVVVLLCLCFCLFRYEFFVY